MTFVQRWNYHNELGAEFPIAPVRVVYAKAGTLPAACNIRDTSFVIRHKLYWSSSASELEAGYLASIFNSEKKAHELYATLAEAGVPSEGAAGSIFEAVSNLDCTMDPTEVKQKAGGGAHCSFDPAK